MVTILLPFIFSLIISLITVPAIITIAYRKRLVDDPRSETRKVHRYSIPNLGGVAVFSTFALISCLFVNDQMLRNANFIFASGIIIFTIGLKDDLIALDPYKKFAAQFLTAFIVVYFANIRVTNLYGVMGIYEIGNILSYILTCFVFVFIINAFNLIDGINGLLGSITSLICITYGTLFYLMNDKGLSVLSFSMAGAVAGFLFYNLRRRARIFMGDAGAYSIGFIVAILSIRFIELNNIGGLPKIDPFTHAAPGIVMALLILPTFDTLRVFALRILRGKSPFMADRNHLHHRLLDLGLTHLQATFTMVVLNAAIIVLAFTFENKVQPAELVVIIILAILFCNMCLWVYEVRNADAISALQRQRIVINETADDAVKHPPLHSQLANTPIAVDSSLVEINVLAVKDNQSTQEEEAAKRFTKEMLDNLERSKN